MNEERQVINLPPRLRRKMLRQVSSMLPEEACGFLAGTHSNVVAVLPVTNRLHSQVRFVMEPMEQWNAMQWIDQNGLNILGIYHSHPTGPATPSASDIKEHSIPEAFCFIWSLTGRRWKLRGFKMLPEDFEELTILSGVKNVVLGE